MGARLSIWKRTEPFLPPVRLLRRVLLNTAFRPQFTGSSAHQEQEQHPGQEGKWPQQQADQRAAHQPAALRQQVAAE